MKREITFLGTGCMQPTKERNHAGIMFNYDEELLLFDCGENIQRQARIAGFKLPKIKKIFITHWHGDHVFGLLGLLNSLSAQKDESTVYIYGPKGTSENVKIIKKLLGNQVPKLTVKECGKGKVVDTEKYVVTSQPLNHSVPCVGFKFEEKTRMKFKMTLLKKFGLKPGPLLGKLQRGKTITHKGKKISPKDVMYEIPGKSFVYITDTRPCKGAETLAKEVDVLIIESTFKEDLQEKAIEFSHLTTKEAALIGNRSGAKKIILTHFSQRYKYVKELEDEAKQYFPEIKAAEDFMKVKL
tara:strand:- start:1445 stop:2338 length:894 start_codon:yes stop_codon:yes gene_type:complete